jgi:hypothetical protein
LSHTSSPRWEALKLYACVGLEPQASWSLLPEN